MSENVAVRARLVELDPRDLRMVELARSLGAPANYAGSEARSSAWSRTAPQPASSPRPLRRRRARSSFLSSTPRIHAVTDLLSIERRGEVAVVTLRRPEKRNALSIELRTELAEAFGGALGRRLRSAASS